jgi:hypothetical protein
VSNCTKEFITVDGMAGSEVLRSLNAFIRRIRTHSLSPRRDKIPSLRILTEGICCTGPAY